jgi:hypothetical protein
MSDLQNIIDLKPYMNVILNVFPIKRTNGLIDDGWTLDFGNSWDNQIMKYDKVAMDWIIPIKQECGGFIKRIHINDLIIPEILDKVSPNFEEGFRQLSSVCNRGLYKADYEKFLALVDNTKPINAYEDDSILGIEMQVSGDGRLGRVLNFPR